MRGGYFLENPNIKIKATLITKEFDLIKKKSDRIKQLFHLTRKKVESFWALRGVSFEIHDGESIGIIGVNGSGKSTLSNILSGIIPPTSGDLEINGETSIIAIGAGLKTQLTGLENIRLKGLMSGMSNKEINEKLNSIIEFADLGDFINQPVKSYSSGMRSRLGFAIAVHQNPDILIIDEALAVGDETFYQKCVKKIYEFKEQGKTIIFVSHSLGQVSKLCDRTIWMNFGEVMAFGPTREVIVEYKKYISWYKHLTEKEQNDFQKKQKQKQKNFKLDDLVSIEISKSIEESNSRKATKDLVEKVKKNKIGDEMKLHTKILLFMLIIMTSFLCVVSFNGNAFSNISISPISFIKEQIIEFSSKWDNNKKSEPSTPNNSSKGNSIDSKPTVTTDTSSQSESESTELPNSMEELPEIQPNDNFSIVDNYTVVEGDTWNSIAALYQITANSLAEANSVTTEYTLKPGDSLSIPWLVNN